jgi:hypothetical protein
MADASNILSAAGTGAAAGTAVAPGIGTAVGAGVGLLAGVVAYLYQSHKEDEADELLKAAQDEAGQMSEASIQRALNDRLGPTALAQIQQDPKFQAIQNDTLAELGRVADSGGMTIEARGQYDDALGQSAQQQTQLRQAALQQMRQRGLNNAGAAVALEAAGAQSSANANAQAGRQMIGDAQRRALLALTQRGNMAGQMQTADWGRQKDVASAQDQINQLQWGNDQRLYGQQRDDAWKKYGFAQANAASVRGDGERGARMAENTGAALGQGAVAAGNYYGGMTDSAPASGPMVVPYAANGGGGDDDRDPRLGDI